MRLLRSAVLVILVAASALTHTSPAYAYPQEYNECYEVTRTYRFDSSWNAYPTEKTWARAAINLWNQPLDYDGTRLETVTELSAAEVVVMVADIPSGTFGIANCVGVPTIKVASDYVTTQRVVYNTARHEMGHLLGMHHSGSQDSWNNDNPPTMATCIPTTFFSFTNFLSQDEQAYANWLGGQLSYRQLHANIGFEQGFGLWGKSAGTVEWLPTGGASGAGVRFKTTTHTSFVYQTVNLAVGDDDLPYRALANYKVGVPGHDGVLEGRMFRHNIAYPGTSTCAYADGLDNLNDPVYDASGFVNMNSTGIRDLFLASSWTSAVSGWVNPPNANGYKLQVRVYAHATDSAGIDQWVYLDNVRGEGQ